MKNLSIIILLLFITACSPQYSYERDYRKQHDPTRQDKAKRVKKVQQANLKGQFGVQN